MNHERIRLGHGAGGLLSEELINGIFRRRFAGGKPTTAPQDSARLRPEGDTGPELAFTTDSYVISPRFFPGGDIGSLAVHGTVNDLAMSGARPLWLSCAVIIEEGFNFEELDRLTASMAAAARNAGVEIVTGDTKVVARGQADGLYINTAGIGVIHGPALHPGRIAPGDAILVNGPLGDHGAAIIAAREPGLQSASLHSDSAPLNGLVAQLQQAGLELHALRDITRGGLAAVLAELAEAAGHVFTIEDRAVPVRNEVRGLCEIYGLDPLELANEGKLVIFLPADQADLALKILHHHPLGRQAARIGRVEAAGNRGEVVLETAFGGRRFLERPTGDLVPRIC